MYITGVSLFLWFVIKRLVVLISATADLSYEKRVVEEEMILLMEKLKQTQVEKADEKSEQEPTGNFYVERAKKAELEQETFPKEVERSRSRSRQKFSLKEE